MFSYNGDGLHFVVSVDYRYVYDWMTFALWYSLQKNLPDASLSIHFKDKKSVAQLFNWCKKCHTPILTSIPEDILLIDPYIMMIRELPEKDAAILKRDGVAALCCNCLDDQYMSFVSYQQGVGNFVTANWINSMDCPFSSAERFMTHSANCNVVRILRLWKQLSPIYATLSRG